MEDKRFVIRYHSQKKKKMNDLIIGGWICVSCKNLIY